MIRKTFLAAGAAIAAMSTAAIASVTIDQNGFGFVGKGDVQLIFGLSNAQIQNALIANPQAFTFSYAEETSYDAVCEWDTITGGKKSKTIHHVVTKTKTSTINALINGSPRKTAGQQQFTGFNLSGFGSTTVTGDEVPVVGGSCVGDPDNESSEGNAIGYYTSVTLSLDNVPGSFFVSYLGNKQPLPLTPVITTTL